MMKSRLTSLLALILIGGYSIASAQGYDDDDIYYNPSKAKAAKTEAKKASTQATVVTDYPAADTYTPSSTSGVNIDIDAYNRRGVFATDTAAATTGNTSNFECTQQIERFYNPRVVIESPDAELAQYYYAEPAEVNIVINTPGYWGYGYSPYYYNSPWYWGTPRSWWYYNSWAYNPWTWGYGPSWSWGWGPSCAWGPAWGPSWGWGGYHPVHRPSWAHRPGGNVRPAYRPGHTPSYGNSRPGNYRPGTTSGYRPGNAGNNSGYRPGRGTTNRSKSSSGYRPGNSNNSNNGYSRPGSNSNRSQSSPSYRSSGSSRSSGSMGGGYRGGGGSSRGGGGGGRGRH